MSAKNAARPPRPGHRRRELHPVRLRADVHRGQRLVIMPAQRRGAGQGRLPAACCPTCVLDQDAARHADPVLRRAAVGHQVHRVGDAAGALDQLRREHPDEPFVPRHERPAEPADHAHDRRWSSPACVLAYAIAMQGHADLRAGVRRLPGDAGRRLRAAGDGPVLEARHHPGRRSSRSPLGIAVWVLFFPQVGGAGGKAFPGQLAGLLAAFVGMVAGSLAPQMLRNRHEPRTTMARLDAASEAAGAWPTGLSPGPPPIIEGFAPRHAR